MLHNSIEPGTTPAAADDAPRVIIIPVEAWARAGAIAFCAGCWIVAGLYALAHMKAGGLW